MINTCHVEGYIYEHDLEIKESGPNSKNPGTEFISGTISVATDDLGVNIVPVHFTYVTATTGSGKSNATYATLKRVIDNEVGTIMKDGKDKAGKVRIDSAIGLNEFYTDRNGKEEFVSAKRAEGGFVHIVDVISEDEAARNTFSCDMVITNVRLVEADEERNLPEKAIVKGAIFDFRNNLLPVEFTATHDIEGCVDYFVGLNASTKNPTFVKVWGTMVSETIKRTIEEKSAFGKAFVREVVNSRKDWVLTGASEEPYEWDVDGILTVGELNEAISKREIDLAAMKSRQDEYKASRNKGPAIMLQKASNDEFKF